MFYVSMAYVSIVLCLMSIVNFLIPYVYKKHIMSFVHWPNVYSRQPSTNYEF